jgi:hypothetical protein
MKASAIALIDIMDSEGKTEDEIIYKVETAFGIGQKTVKDRLELRDRLRQTARSNT